MASSNLDRIRRISGSFQQLFGLLLYLVPISTVAFWLAFNHLPQSFKNELPVVVSQSLPVSSLLLAIGVSAIPTGIIMLAFIHLRRLFALYREGIIFSIANADCYRSLGSTLIYWAFSKLAFVPLISVVLTLNNPPGEKTLVLSIGSADLGNILLGCLVLIISWVMHEASVLEEESQFTV